VIAVDALRVTMVCQRRGHVETARSILEELLNVIFSDAAMLSTEQRARVHGICLDALRHAVHMTSAEAAEGERVMARARLDEHGKHRFDISTAEARESTAWRLCAADVRLIADEIRGRDLSVDHALGAAIELFLKEAAIDEDMF